LPYETKNQIPITVHGTINSFTRLILYLIITRNIIRALMTVEPA